MLKEIKKIRLEKINLELQKYEDLKKEMKEIEDSLMDCKNTILELEKKKFSFLDRYLLKRELFEETGLKIREKRELYNQLLLRLKVVEEKIETMSEYRNEVSSINRAKTLSDLGLSFDDAIKLLEEHGVEFVLNESDKEITLNDSSFDERCDFVLVHKAMQRPSGNSVVSVRNANAYACFSYTLSDGTKIRFDIKKCRNTVHFSLNGEVSSHIYGTFDNRKYAILVPFDKVNTSNMLSFSPEDTYFSNGLDISFGYILCPCEEVELVRRENPNVNVVGYVGSNVDGYANSLLSILGYKYKEVGKDNWTYSSIDLDTQNDINKYNIFREKNNFKNCSHYGSFYHALDDKMQKFYSIIGFAKGIKDYIDNNEVVDEDDFICKIYSSFNSVPISNFLELEKEIFLANYIDTSYVSKNDVDSKESNLGLLLYELKSNFGIELSKDVIDIIKNFDSKMLSSEMNELIDKCNKYLKCVYSDNDKVKLIFMRDLLHQLLLEKKKSVSSSNNKSR